MRKRNQNLDQKFEINRSLKFQKGFSMQIAWVGSQFLDFYGVIEHALSDEAVKVIFQRPC